MANPNLSISRLITVNLILSPLGAQAQNLTDLLVLGSSSVVDVTERWRTYTGITAIANDFGTTAPEYLAANLWFQQAPQPAEIKIGRWARTATIGKLVGGALSAANSVIAPWQAIVTPSFEVELDGIPRSIAPTSFAGAANLNAVAAIIQTALQALAAASTCVYNSVYNRFEFQSANSGVGSSFGLLNAPTATGTLTFAANPLNLDTITLNGTVITFRSTVVAGTVLIGATLAATLTNLQVFLAASVDAQLVKFLGFTSTLNPTVFGLKAATPGAGGNALSLASSSVNVTLSAATLLGGGGTDISVMLAANATPAYQAPGIAAETAVAAATLFDANWGQLWYALTFVGAATADHLAVAAFVEAATNKHIYGVSTQDGNVLVATDTTNIAYQLSQLLYKRTVTQYSSTSPYSVASLLGRILTVDFTANSSVITLMYKQEPGIVAETLTPSQVNALEAFNANVFVAYNNNTAIIEPGKVASGDFLDTIIGTDWLATTILADLYNLLYTSPTKVPQTDAGMHLLVTTIENRCVQGVNNGLIAAGTWNTAGFGSLKQGDYMEKGYYVFAPLLSSQNPTDRGARKSVPIQVAVKLAGAVHFVNVSITINR
jgi:hypothetical protein